MEYTEQQFSQAADTCDRFAVALQGMQDAAGILRSVGSLKSMVKELTKQREQAQSSLDRVNGELITAKAALEYAQAECAGLRDQTQADVDHALKEAKANAQKIAKEAAERAALDLEAAKKEHANELVGVKNEIAKAKKELEALSAHLKAAIEAEAAMLKKKEELEKEIAAIHARAAKLAGVS